MKKLITVILILAAGQAFAQKTVNDTLIIQYSPKIKFIKFGERIYEVVQPSLKEFQQPFYDTMQIIRPSLNPQGFYPAFDNVEWRPSLYVPNIIDKSHLETFLPANK